MSNPHASSSDLSSSEERSFPYKNSKNGVATTSKPTAKAKSRNEKSVAVQPDAAPNKEKPRSTVKMAIPSTPLENASPGEPSAKKQKSSGMFDRKWTDEEEITLLNEKVKYPMSKGKEFHSLVKNKLIGDFDSKQVVGKLRNLKKKYTNSSKKKTLTPHEKKLVKLSKPIWGAISDTKDAAEEEGAAAVDDAVDDDDDAAAEEEDDDAEEEEDAAEDDAEEEEDDDDADNDAAEDDAADNETNNVCKKKKEWKFIGKKSIAMGLDAATVKDGLEGRSDAVKVENKEEWEKLFLEKSALYEKKLNLGIKESTLLSKGLKK